MNLLKKSTSILSLTDSISSLKSSRLFGGSRNDLTEPATFHVTIEVQDDEVEAQLLVEKILDSHSSFIRTLTDLDRKFKNLQALEAHLRAHPFDRDPEPEDFIQNLHGDLIHGDLGGIFRKVCVDVHTFRQFNGDKSAEHLDFIAQYIAGFADDLRKLHGFTGDRLLGEILDFLHQLTHVDVEFAIKNQLVEVQGHYKSYLDDCKLFLATVEPILREQKKYEAHRTILVGKMVEICEEVEKLTCAVLVCVQVEDVARLIFNSTTLHRLYEDHSKTNMTGKMIKMAFCQENKIDARLFSLIMDHLVAVKLKFSNIRENCRKMRAPRDNLDQLLRFLDDFLLRLDYTVSSGHIVGLTISEDMGKILLRSPYGAKEKTKQQTDVILFLFEKFVVLTEEVLVKNVFCYSCREIFPTDRLNYQTYDDNEIIFNVGGREISVFSNRPHHGNIAPLREKLGELLLRQIKLFKENL